MEDPQIIAAQHYHFILEWLDRSEGHGFISKAKLRKAIETHLFQPETRVQFGPDSWETPESAKRRALNRPAESTK